MEMEWDMIKCHSQTKMMQIYEGPQFFHLPNSWKFRSRTWKLIILGQLDTINSAHIMMKLLTSTEYWALEKFRALKYVEILNLRLILQALDFEILHFGS